MKKLLIFSLIALYFQPVFSQSPSADELQTVTYDEAEIKPEYLGGYSEFIKYIGTNYKSPEVEGLSGVIRLSFVIELNGRVTNIKIMKDIGSGSGDEGVRVLRNCPIWMPGEIDGKRVRVRMEVPIKIRT